MVIRNAMEDFHCEHLTDDQMKDLNPIIRDAVCTALHAFNNYEQAYVGQMLKAISPLTKGSGGGRPEFAQAGGKDPSGIPAALKKAEELVREALERS